VTALTTISALPLAMFAWTSPSALQRATPSRALGQEASNPDHAAQPALAAPGAQQPSPVQPTELSTLTILRSSASGVDAEVRFGALQLAEHRVGEYKLSGMRLEGAGHRIVRGEPIVPVRRVLLELPDSGEVSFHAEAVHTDSIAAQLSPVPSDADAPEPAGSPFAPGEFARLDSIGWMRGRRVAILEVRPVLWDSRSALAQVVRTMRLRLEVSGGSSAPASELGGTEIDTLYKKLVPNAGTLASGSSPTGGLAITLPSGPLSSPAPTSGGSATAGSQARSARVRIDVTQRGMHAITPTALAAAGIQTALIDPRKLQITHLGQPIPIEIDGESDGKLDPGDRIIFFGIPSTSRYTHQEVYWLEERAAGAPLRMTTASGTVIPGATVATTFRETLHLEQNSLYYQLMPGGFQEDHWFWTKTLAPSNTDFAMTLKDVVALPGGNIRVRAALFGYTNTAQNPDHHTKILFNGTTVSDATWNGIVPQLHDGTISNSAVTGEPATVRVQQIADTGAIVDGIYSDWVEVEYDRGLFSVADALELNYSSTNPTTFPVRRFSNADARVYDVTNPEQPKKLVGTTVTPVGATFTVSFSTIPGSAPGSRYSTATPAGMLAPVLSLPHGPIGYPTAGADWIAICPSALRASVLPLAQHRAASGLRTAVIDLEAIYDAFGNGLRTPDAIRAFATWAYTQSPAPAPAYLCIVGEASSDYRNYLGFAVANQVPPPMHGSAQEGEIPSDYYYSCLVGNDPLPELLVGRIPANTPAEVATVVSKIVLRETAPPAGPWRTRVLHVADKAGNFATNLNALAATHVPGGFSVATTYYDNYSTSSAMKAATIASLSAGNAICTYLGHGAITNMGSFFNTADVASVANTDTTHVQMILNCTAGYYASPATQHCLAEEFVLRSHAGSVATFSSVTLGFLSQLMPISERSYDRIFAGQSLGAATTGGKLDAFTIDGIFEDNLWEVQLLGDPATRVLPGP